ncbi:MAG: hypothetical protein M1818_003566 [Claussenomyces sp. TS43310]|nr:MAG: hypothetical protein M1818_003566 [Claussenomyces sp. TS43310]
MVDQNHTPAGPAKWQEQANGDGRGADQYQHFIPRFILKRFAPHSSKSLSLWVWWTGRAQSRTIQTTFGITNLYNAATEGITSSESNVEKLLADLEGAMGRIARKIDDALAQDGGSDAPPGVHLLESEVDTVYRFIYLAVIRNGPLALYGSEHHAEPVRKSIREEWLNQLRFFLRTSHREVLEMNELLLSPSFRPALAQYKRMAAAKLLFWTTPRGEEFLLSNLLVGLEGYQSIKVDGAVPERYPAHTYIPISHNILIVLCTDVLCERSTLYGVPHGVTTPYERPAKGKLGKTEGRKKYQAALPNWKTIFPITPICVDDIGAINCSILAASSVVVYKTQSTLEKAVRNIIPFSNQHSSWRKGLLQSGVQLLHHDIKKTEEMEKMEMALLTVIKESFRPSLGDFTEEMEL